MDRLKRYIITIGNIGAEAGNVCALEKPEDLASAKFPFEKGSRILLVHADAGPEFLAAAWQLKKVYGAYEVIDWYRKNDWSDYESVVCDALLLEGFRDEGRYLRIPFGSGTADLAANPVDHFVLGYARSFPERLWNEKAGITVLAEKERDIRGMIRFFIADNLQDPKKDRNSSISEPVLPEHFLENETRAVLPAIEFAGSGITWENTFSRKKTRDPETELSEHLKSYASLGDEAVAGLHAYVKKFLQEFAGNAVRLAGYTGAAGLIREKLMPEADELEKKLRESERTDRHEERILTDKLRNADHHARNAPLERGVRSESAADYAAALDAVLTVRRRMIDNERICGAVHFLTEEAEALAGTFENGAKAAASFRAETAGAGREDSGTQDACKHGGSAEFERCLPEKADEAAGMIRARIIGSREDIARLEDELFSRYSESLKEQFLQEASDDRPSAVKEHSGNLAMHPDEGGMLREEKNGIVRILTWYPISYTGRYRSDYLTSHIITEEERQKEMLHSILPYFEKGILTADSEKNIRMREKVLEGVHDLPGLVIYMLDHPGEMAQLKSNGLV